ncbi:NU6M oxidoreductase, partial [Horornis vulcanius]|nr:NU6M oxidoreductase [Horornis vulcanius]
MRNFVVFRGTCFFLAELAVASNPYYYGVVGLVLAFVSGCQWLMSPVTSFVLLVLFLVYLGRVLVGFFLLCLWLWTPFQKHGGIEELLGVA